MSEFYLFTLDVSANPIALLASDVPFLLAGAAIECRDQNQELFHKVIEINRNIYI